MGLRLMIFDDTCRSGRYPLGLTHSWIAGYRLYKGLGRLDGSFGARDWDSALDWLAHFGDGEIDEIQFWGHGKWGRAKIAQDVLDLSSLKARQMRLGAVKERLHAESVWWFRTCETLGADPGHRFAAEWADHFGCPVAGHTFIIGPWQSGLHLHRPGTEIHWSAWEGIAEGSPDAPKKSLWSGPLQPNTISCLQGHIPEGW